MIAALAANDLENVVVAHHPEIATLRDSLKERGAILAQMSGSGSTVFGVFDAPQSPLSIDGARVVPTSTVEKVAPVEYV
jgi:4-diphosphocytidyl-2C-methyl-D-erythritol kinase